MKCPICQSETKVVDTRASKTGIRRRRECLDCLTRFSTYETLLVQSLENVKQYVPDDIDKVDRINTFLKLFGGHRKVN